MVLKNFTRVCVASLLYVASLSGDGLQNTGLKSNGQLVYASKQKEVSSLGKMFEEGRLYSRLRNNNFYFAYDTPSATKETHLVSAIGGSFVYKSAVFHGFDVTLSLYGSKSFFDASALDSVSNLKASKDTLNRFKYVNGGSTSLFAFAQENVSYKFSKTKLIFGRQLVENFYAKSNDTKMIPNAFDGISINSSDILSSKISVAYLTKQKLRDHEESHSVLMVGDDNSTSGVSQSSWTQNDDSAMHKGLTYTALKAAGKPTDAPLILLDFQNNSLKNLKLNFASYVVPELLAQTMGEINYKLEFNGFSITPGVRYIEQFDNGAGAVGGASITLLGLNGYKDPSSLASSMVGARVVTRFDDYKINLAYTAVADRADLVTPWRAFPTSGYTRSMGMYNWRANLKSYRVELVKGANKKGIYTDGFVQASVLYMNGDESKSDTDSMFYYFGYVKNLKLAPAFQYRLRLGYRDYIGSSDATSSYLDSRFELNYLF